MSAQKSAWPAMREHLHLAVLQHLMSVTLNPWHAGACCSERAPSTGRWGAACVAPRHSSSVAAASAAKRRAGMASGTTGPPLDCAHRPAGGDAPGRRTRHVYTSDALCHARGLPALEARAGGCAPTCEAGPGNGGGVARPMASWRAQHHGEQHVGNLSCWKHDGCILHMMDTRLTILSINIEENITVGLDL